MADLAPAAPAAYGIPVLGPDQEFKPLLGREQQDLKSAVHRQLIERVDLEKLLTMQDLRARQPLLNIILPLVSEQGVPLSTIERDRIASEVLDEVFGLGPAGALATGSHWSTTSW